MQSVRSRYYAGHARLRNPEAENAALLWFESVAPLRFYDLQTLVRSVCACRNRDCVRLVRAVAAATCSNRDAGIVQCHVVCLEEDPSSEVATLELGFLEFVAESMNYLTNGYDKFFK